MDHEVHGNSQQMESVLVVQKLAPLLWLHFPTIPTHFPTAAILPHKPMQTRHEKKY